MSGVGVDLCGATWRSDPNVICAAQAVAPNEPCLAHHGDREALVKSLTFGGGLIRLDRSEVDSELVALICSPGAARKNLPIVARFDGATFTGDAWFHGATFTGDDSFGGDRLFYCATFTGDASFREATFTGDAWFHGATFTGDAWFHGATFTGDASFDGATFTGDASFDGATFTGDAWFDGATFTGDARFDGATFTGDASFRKATGVGTIYLARTRFSGTSSALIVGHVATKIHDVHFDAPIVLTSEQSTTALKATMGCTLTKPFVVDSNVWLTETLFAGTVGLDQLSVRGDAHWPKGDGRRQVIADELEEKDGVNDAELELLYRQLRRSLELSKAHSAANDFYFGELEARRRQRSIWSAERLLLSAYRNLLGYGVRASRPMFWWIVTTLLLTVSFTRYTNELLDPNPVSGIKIGHWRQAFAFVMQNTTNLLRATDGGLEWSGTLLLLFGRFTTVTLLAGVFFALRSRVTR